MKNAESKRIRSHFIELASKMPPLSHYPDKSKPFREEDSEVIKWLISQPHMKQWLFDKARNSKAIVFNPSTGLWSGVLTDSNPT